MTPFSPEDWSLRKHVEAYQDLEQMGMFLTHGEVNEAVTANAEELEDYVEHKARLNNGVLARYCNCEMKEGRVVPKMRDGKPDWKYEGAAADADKEMRAYLDKPPPKVARLYRVDAELLKQGREMPTPNLKRALSWMFENVYWKAEEKELDLPEELQAALDELNPKEDAE